MNSCTSQSDDICVIVWNACVSESVPDNVTKQGHMCNTASTKSAKAQCAVENHQQNDTQIECEDTGRIKMGSDNLEAVTK